MTEKTISSGRALILVLGCFFLSGMTGLVYEILWTRMIVQLIGAAPFAVSIVLTVFMGGLGLGSYLASRTIDHVREPAKLVKIYALLELGIGAYGVLLPLLLSAFGPLYAVMYNRIFDHFILYNLLVFIGCSVILCIPVICMGATLPILCRYYVTRLSHLGTHAGRLYGLNTIGAAAGALLCGFWLINLLGVQGTLILAVTLNTLIGISCLLVSFSCTGRGAAREPGPGESVEAGDTFGPGHRQPSTDDADSGDTAFHPYAVPRPEAGAGNGLQTYSGEATGALVIFAVSGFCAMSYEVIWAKLLGLIVGPTTYSFTIVLVTFILSLALGSMLFGWLGDRTRNVMTLLLVTQVLAALFALAVSQLLGNSQLFFARVIFQFKDHFALLSLVKAAVLLVFMILPTICLGATFPLVGKLYTPSISKVGRSIGSAYAVNTIGAVSGSFCAGFILVPLVGKENGLSLVVALQLLAALIIATAVFSRRRSTADGDRRSRRQGAEGKPCPGSRGERITGRARRRMDYLRWLLVTVPALAGLILSALFPRWNHHLLSSGKYHRFNDLPVDVGTVGYVEALLHGTELMAGTRKGDLVYYGEGIGGFTTVLKFTDVLGNDSFIMANSGKADASSRTDMKTQTLLAHLPLLFHPDPGAVLVIGLASGITAGEILNYPVERLDVVDINEQVVAASDFFLPWNNRVLSNPRTDLIIQDGRAHLFLTRRRYDVIISEPSNPWMAGLAALFTREYFGMAEEKLAEEGIFVQFIHSYQMDWDTFAMVGRTFAEVFPASLLLQTSPSGMGGDYLHVGLKGIEGLNLQYARSNLPGAGRSTNVSLSDPELLYRLIVSEDLPGLFGPGPVNTDRRPRLEFAAPRLLHYNDPAIVANIRSRGWCSPATKKIHRRLAADVDSRIDFSAYALSLHVPFPGMVDLSKTTEIQKDRYFRMMEEYCADNLIDETILESEDLKRRCRLARIASLERKIDGLSDRSDSYSYLGNLYFKEGRLEESIACFTRSLEESPDDASTLAKLGTALVRAGEFERAMARFSEALRIRPDLAEAHNSLGGILQRQGRLDEAIFHLRQAMRIRSDWIVPMNNLAWILATRGEPGSRDPGEAVKLAERVCELGGHERPDLLDTLAVAYAAAGRFPEAIATAEQAVRLASSSGQERLALEIRKHLRLFMEGRSYIEGIS